VTDARTDWRLCEKCQSLFMPEGLTSVQVTGGVCPGDYIGGPHRSVTGITYEVTSVPAEGGPAVGQWDLCRKCGMLYSIATAGNFGICPGDLTPEGAYLGHESREPEEAGSATFTLPSAASGGEGRQNGWQLCDACQVLFFAEGPDAAICPGAKNSPHKSSSGVKYGVTLGPRQ
jgi:hypothetical protein